MKTLLVIVMCVVMAGTVYAGFKAGQCYEEYRMTNKKSEPIIPAPAPEQFFDPGMRFNDREGYDAQFLKDSFHCFSATDDLDFINCMKKFVRDTVEKCPDRDWPCRYLTLAQLNITGDIRDELDQGAEEDRKAGRNPYTEISFEDDFGFWDWWRAGVACMDIYENRSKCDRMEKAEQKRREGLPAVFASKWVAEARGDKPLCEWYSDLYVDCVSDCWEEYWNVRDNCHDPCRNRRSLILKKNGIPASEWKKCIED